MLNRANRRARCFEDASDYMAFERILEDAVARSRMRLLSYVVMPNHFHFVLHPRRDGDMGRFMQWLQQVHAQRWNGAHGAVGTGHLYQGRYKSFLIQNDAYLLNVLRYVEANPVRAGLTGDGAAWRWGSMYRRGGGTTAARELLSAWPVRRPAGWAAQVNGPAADHDGDRIRHSIARGTPYGDEGWVQRTARRYGIESAVRQRGRPALA
ncbi:MAG: transposase [Planctomycetota bacterium]